MASNHVHNITIIGAGGTMGLQFAKALVAQGKHTVNAITRPDSNTAVPEGLAKVHKVQYDDHAALVAALQGQDVLIITLAVMAGEGTQQKLIEAAIEAGVTWIMPNEYGNDVYSDPAVGKDVLVGPKAVAIREHIETTSKEKNGGKTKWIALMCGFWYEFSLAGTEARYGFDLNAKKVTFYDEGNEKISTTTWPRCGEAVAKLFALPIQAEKDGGLSLNDFANKHVPVTSFNISQRDMFASLLRVTGSKESDWTIAYEGSKARYERGKEMLFKNKNQIGFGILLYARMFYPGAGGYALPLVNDELGLTKEDLDQSTRAAVDLHESDFFQKSYGRARGS